MKRKRLISILLILIMAASLMTGCGGGGNSGDDVPKIDGLKYESTMELKYATQFQIYNYEGGYSYIRIVDGEDVLIVPEDGETPEGIGEDVVVLKRPLDISLYGTLLLPCRLVNAQ